MNKKRVREGYRGGGLLFEDGDALRGGGGKRRRRQPMKRKLHQLLKYQPRQIKRRHFLETAQQLGSSSLSHAKF